MASKRKCNECSMKRLYEKIETLEKALDIACEILEPKMKCLTGKTKKQWKKFLLEKVRNNNDC